jgi:hypothetical protein
VLCPSGDVRFDRNAFLDIRFDPATQAHSDRIADIFGNRNAFYFEDVKGEHLGLELFAVMRELLIEMLLNDVTNLVKIEKETFVRARVGGAERRNVKHAFDVARGGAVPLPSMFRLRNSPAARAVTPNDLINPFLR